MGLADRFSHLFWCRSKYNHSKCSFSQLYWCDDDNHCIARPRRAMHYALRTTPCRVQVWRPQLSCYTYYGSTYYGYTYYGRCGDLNYRLDLPRADVLKRVKARDWP